MALVLPQLFVDEMIEHARDAAPDECCGLISAVEGRAAKLYRMRNAAEEVHRPVRYEMDGKELLARMREMDAENAEVFVIYHSHLRSEAYPSPTDVRLAHWPQSDPPVEIFPDAYYVLVSLRYDPPAVRAFRIAGKQITEEALEIEP
jgi:proteasome lid subunit RPN8/RPN11